MSHTFANLSPADFEELACDLVGRALEMRFESFGPGPDGGIDGRHSSAKGTVILQAKHYAGSTFAKLLGRMKLERRAIDKLSPNRYVLVTSQSLSPRQKAKLAEVLGPSLKNQSDIFGGSDLNILLKRWPDVERSHIKLWLSSAAVLTQILRAAEYKFTSWVQSDTEKTVKLYADNSSFPSARDILEEHHVVIISGAPGVGKSTLARMLSYYYIANNWDFTALRHLDDGLACIDDSKKQVFLFDDFLGTVSLEARDLSQKDSDLARFIRQVRASPNARFILATRAHLLEKARLISEHLANKELNIVKYVLDVGIYTRRIKARILYNHLLFSGISQNHITDLVRSRNLPTIVDHKNYNPRIVEWMTTLVRIREIAPYAYATSFLSALTNPDELWDIPFHNQISDPCRDLLFAIFWGNEKGIEISDLRQVYNSLHERLSNKYRKTYDARDFEQSLRVLEGGFVAISGRNVSFVNPSLRDYLRRSLSDPTLICDFASAAVRTDQARAIWDHANRLSCSNDDRARVALSFGDIVSKIVVLPTWKVAGGELRPVGLSNTERIVLLLEWWEITRDQRFLDCAMSLAKTPVQGLAFWRRDGRGAIELLSALRPGYRCGDLGCSTEMAGYLQKAIIRMIDRSEHMAPHFLEDMFDAIDNCKMRTSGLVPTAIRTKLREKFDDKDLSYFVEHLDAESVLEDTYRIVYKLGNRIGLAEKVLYSMKRTVAQRIAEVLKDRINSLSPVGGSSTRSDPDDEFNDIALMNLFQTLLPDRSSGLVCFSLFATCF